jgi:hypothetical protein
MGVGIGESTLYEQADAMSREIAIMGMVASLVWSAQNHGDSVYRTSVRTTSSARSSKVIILTCWTQRFFGSLKEARAYAILVIARCYGLIR